MIIKEKEVKIVDKAKWLIPGLQIKRWFLLYLFSATLMLLGLLIIFGFKPVYYIMEFIKYVADVVPTTWLATGMVILGLGLFCIAWTKTCSATNGNYFRAVV